MHSRIREYVNGRILLRNSLNNKGAGHVSAAGESGRS